MPGLYFEQFSVGQTFDHPIRRTITESDNVLLTTMTHNPAALHLDAEYMKTTEFGQPLVNSCLTLFHHFKKCGLCFCWRSVNFINKN